MDSKHWTDDDLLDALYGAGPSPLHLDECAPCRERWKALRSERQAVLGERAAMAAALPPAFFAAQRRAVYDRLESEPRPLPRLRFASALALLLLCAFSLFEYTPDTPVRVAAPVVSDAQLISDVSSMLESPLPQPLSPVRGLFEEN